jgi:DNA (cytosine-5)-methyltransferase 1
MRYGSLCSGIEAVSVAWGPLGHVPAFFAEIDPFCSAVLHHHWPDVPNLGDIASARFLEEVVRHGPIDVLVGGSPCQSFSLAGFRKGLADPRGGLVMSFLHAVRTIRPTWFLWENVPGLLSQRTGRDFGAILGAVADLGYGFAYRVLDAQFFGVPQQRRRLFLLGHSGGHWGPPAQVLFEPGTLSDDTVAVRTHRTRPARVAESDSRVPGLPCLVRVHGERSSSMTGKGWSLVADVVPRARCLDTTGGYATNQGGTLVVDQQGIRRLTPRECERLQGLPDDHTLVPWRGGMSPDGRRYKAIGNSMAVPVLRWLGRRLGDHGGTGFCY